MLPPYLTDPEIADITAPLTRADARCRYLRGQGLIVREKPNGQPLVGRRHFEEWAGARTVEQPPAGEAPNEAAFLRVIKGRRA